MLVCSVALRPKRLVVAAEIVEAAVALDDSTIGNIAFPTLVDEPAEANEIVDAFPGQFMLEAATALDTVDGAMAASVFSGDIVEVASAADTQSGATGVTDANVKLLMGFNGANGSTGAPGMTDESPSARGTATANGAAQISTAQFKFGASSLFVNGVSNSCIVFPDSADWDFGSGPFTIEGFFRFAATSTNALLVGQWTGGFAFWFEGGRLYLRAGGTTDTVKYTWAPTLNQWYHIAIDRDATLVVRLYVDGAMVTKTTGYNVNITGSSSVLMAGSLTPGGFSTYNMNGYIDELRISNVARYGSDSGFTVPTSPYPR